MSPAPHCALLAADIGPVIEAVIILLVIIGSGVVRLAGSLKPKPQRPPGGPPAARPPAKPSPLDDEIGEFLRRVSQGRPAAAPAAKPRRPQPAAKAERAAPRPSAGSQFERQQAQLGDAVAKADENMDQRLQGVFEHNVGNLQAAASDTSTGAASPTGPPPLAESLLAMLSRPESIRQAIILNEVLQRPEGRWK